MDHMERESGNDPTPTDHMEKDLGKDTTLTNHMDNDLVNDANDFGKFGELESDNDESDDSDFFVDIDNMLDDINVDMQDFEMNIDKDVEWVGGSSNTVVGEGTHDEALEGINGQRNKSIRAIQRAHENNETLVSEPFYIFQKFRQHYKNGLCGLSKVKKSISANFFRRTWSLLFPKLARVTLFADVVTVHLLV
uniref:Uncharacterized protein n=1 Tax=Lactuca sativa TaxID=4236 RepID=A0A9R1VUV5_LACSA|nr:hypothetical protein LSAT_V11C400194460 [Lactuca sativa]